MLGAAIAASFVVAQAVTPQAPAAATGTSGNQLFDWCGHRDGGPLDVLCLGYINGVMDGIGVTEAAHNTTHFYCVPQGVTNNQSRDVVIAYLRDHPNLRHLAAYVLVLQSLRVAFPCQAPATR